MHRPGTKHGCVEGRLILWALVRQPPPQPSAWRPPRSPNPEERHRDRALARPRTLDEVRHVLERARLLAVAVDGHRLPGQRLRHEVADHAPVVQRHARPVRVEDAHHAHLRARMPRRWVPRSRRADAPGWAPCDCSVWVRRALPGPADSTTVSPIAPQSRLARRPPSALAPRSFGRSPQPLDICSGARNGREPKLPTCARALPPPRTSMPCSRW